MLSTAVIKYLLLIYAVYLVQVPAFSVLISPHAPDHYAARGFTVAPIDPFFKTYRQDLYPCGNNLQEYSLDQYKQHFIGCSPQYILEQYPLFMSNEFVLYAKNLFGYEATITTLHAQLREQSGFFKWLGCLWGTHCKGLTARIDFLYQEIQTKKAQLEAVQYRLAQENYYTDQLKQLSQEPFLNTARKEAFDATIANPHHRAIRSFEVDPGALSYIKAYDVTAPDVTTIQANPYEYQLHTEFIQQLKTLVPYADNGDQSDTHDFLLDALSQSIALGIQANKNQAPLIATRWANFGWQALEIATGIGEGGLLGVYNTAFLVKNTLCHPLDAAYDFLHALRTITTAAGRAVGSCIELGTLCIAGNSAQAYEEAQKIYTAAQLIMQECTAKLEAMSHKEIAKQTTALATEYMLTSKALTLGHTICARAGPLLADAIEILRTEPALECAIAGAEGTVHCLSEVAKHSGGAKKTLNAAADAINQNSLAIFKNGYYEVNGFKFSQYYYERLWESGRAAPSLIAKLIVDNTTKIIPDPAGHPGFFKYSADRWEMIYNPTTKIVSHMQLIKKKGA